MVRRPFSDPIHLNHLIFRLYNFTMKSLNTKVSSRCDTQWTNLSCQARRLDLPKEPYFDPKTMLLSKEVNIRLWKQLSKLYNVLGPERAPLATPVMVEGGEVKWFSYMEGSKGQEGMFASLFLFCCFITSWL